MHIYDKILYSSKWDPSSFFGSFKVLRQGNTLFSIFIHFGNKGSW